MLSSHRASRRHYPEEDDELPLTVTRIDDHRDTHPHSHHHSSRSEMYIASSSTARANYHEPEPSARGYRADDWRTRDSVAYPSSSHDRYHETTYNHHPRREDYYERQESRQVEHWPSRNEQHYTSSNRDWQKHTDHEYVSVSYTESRRSWRYGDNETYEHWSNTQEPPRRERERARYEREEDYGPQTTQETHGWRRDSGWRDDDHKSGWVERTDDRNSTRQTTEYRATEDRTWEPAPSWKGREKEPASQPQRVENRHNRSSKKAMKSGKRIHGGKRTDRRKDDSHMNNWQKRDYRTVSTQQNNKHKHSYSRSRSRESSYSRRSSYKSRSRSVSPKRNRWEDNTSDRRDPSPRRENKAKSSNADKYAHKANRRIDESRGRQRRQTSSSPSSRSQSRSRSRSRSRSVTPEKRQKAPHRLPTATSIHDINITTKSLSAKGTPPNRWNEKADARQKNGHSYNAESNLEMKSPAVSSYKDDTHPISPSTSMAPPILVPSQHVPGTPMSTAPLPPSNTATESPLKPVIPSIKRHAGFKPIGQSNAAVRRFFPGDDDDDDDEPIEKVMAGATIRSEEPTGHVRQQQPTPHFVRATVEAHPLRNGERFNDESRLPTPVEPPPPRREIDDEMRPASIQADFSAQPSPAIRSNEGMQESSSHPSVTQTPVVASPDRLYAIVNQVGEGTFGKVYKAQNTVTGQFVALKRIRMEAERDGFPVTAMREIKLLQSLKHNNVVRLYEMMVHNDRTSSVYMVFEYMDHDLTGVLSQTQFEFTSEHLKSLCQQMLAGLAYLHHKGVIHRDIKGSNILINNRGELKLGDFGLARFYQKRRRSDYTNRVITLWYRPPELLLGTTVYGPEVDMWSAGCIMLELFCKKPVFQGNDEIDQLDKVYSILGTPTVDKWPSLVDMPWYELMKPRETIPNRFRTLFQKWLSPAGLDLAEWLLTYDPMQRATAAQALDAPYFTQEQPPAALPVGLSTLEGEWHEFESKRERARKRRRIEAPQ